MPLIQNFSFRYLNTTEKVYLRTLSPCNNIVHAAVATHPFTHRSEGETRNAVIGYKTLSSLHYHNPDVGNACILEVNVETCKYMSSLLQMPLIVIMNEFALIQDQSHHFEIYYFYDHNKNHTFNVKNLNRILE